MRAEVAVVGGGLAGASFAAQIATAGRDVLLIEREAQPHDKVCGEFLSREAQLYLRALGVDLPALGAVPIGELGLAAGARAVSTRLPFQAMSLTRRVLDEAVLAHAIRTGVRVLRGRRVTGAAPVQGGIGLALEDGAVVTAATGVLATGKHDLRGHPRPPGRQTDLIGFKMLFRLAPRQRAALLGRIDLMLFAGGYAGLQPVEGDAEGERANLCLLVRRDRFAALGRRWEALLAAIGAETPLLATRLDGACAAWSKPLGIAGLPYGLVARKTPADGLWRLGDQAAVIPSFSGDGMSIALHSARRAAIAYLAGETPDRFQRALAADLGAQVTRATWLSRIFVHPRPQAGLLMAARLVPRGLDLGVAWTRVPERALRGALRPLS
jgi:flavin-dependent dehydrogenase